MCQHCIWWLDINDINMYVKGKFDGSAVIIYQYTSHGTIACMILVIVHRIRLDPTRSCHSSLLVCTALNIRLQPPCFSLKISKIIESPLQLE